MKNLFGFAVKMLYRVTSGPRAVLFWMSQLAQTVTLPTGHLQRLTVRALRKFYALNRARIDGFIDRRLAGYAVRSEPAEGVVNFCVGLLASAEKLIAAAADRAR